jgi:hypothetical protein
MKLTPGKLYTMKRNGGLRPRGSDKWRFFFAAGTTLMYLGWVKEGNYHHFTGHFSYSLLDLFLAPDGVIYEAHKFSHIPKVVKEWLGAVPRSRIREKR